MAKAKKKLIITVGDQEYSVRFNEERGVFECSVPFKADDGSTKRRTFRHRNQETLGEMIKEFKTHQENADNSLNPSTITLRQFADYWLHEVKRQDLRQTTWEIYEGNFRVHILPELGDTLLKNLSTEQLQKFFNSKYEDGARRDGKPGSLALNTIFDMRKVLRAALNDAIKMDKLEKNPILPVKFRKDTKETGRALTEEEMSKLYTTALHDRLFPALVLEFGTGIRRGELLGLRWPNVDLTNGFITITESLIRTRSGEIKLQEPKTKKSTRCIPLPRQVWQCLMIHKQSQDKEKRTWQEEYDDSGFVFCDSKGQPIAPDKFYKHFKNKWAKPAGLGDIRFHDLRHTHATQMIALGIHLKTLQERLGHADFNTTYNRYGRVHSSMQQEASNKLDEGLFANLQKIRAEAPAPAQQKNDIDINIISEVAATTTETEKLYN